MPVVIAPFFSMPLSIHVAVRRAVAVVVFLATALGAAAQITLPTATFGAPYSYQVTTQPPPVAGSIYSASGLPTGLAINSASGLISGTPTTPGVATGTITITSGSFTNSFSYSLVVNQAPVVTAISAPRQVVMLGQDLTLKVTATSGTAFTYQWKRNGRSIPGATNANLTITAAVPYRDNGWYQVVLANSSGSTTSAVVFVNVAIPNPEIVGFGNADSGRFAVPAGLGPVVAVGTNDLAEHTLAIKADGTVVGWGYNGYGQTTPPAGLNNVVAVSCSMTGSAALRVDGTVAVWGQVGSSVPASLTNVVALAISGNRSLALKSDGTIVSWGSGLSVPAGLTDVVAIASSGRNCLALKADGAVIAWGEDAYNLSTVPAGLAGVVAIGAGLQHSIALKADGTVVGWGASFLAISPAVAASLVNVVAIANGAGHDLALKADGTVIGWPATTGGPTDVPAGLSRAMGIAGGTNFSQVLRDATPLEAPAFSLNPRNVSAVAGTGSVTLQVEATGYPTPFFQWQRQTAGSTVFSNLAENAVFSGVTTKVLRVTAPTLAMNGDQFRCVATNESGTASTASALLAVLSPPVISVQPLNQTIVTGLPVTFTVFATGTGPLTYQWRRNGFDLPGATAATYAIPAANRSAADTYDVRITDSTGSIFSNGARLSVAPTSYPTYVAPDPAWDLRPEVDGATISVLLPLADGRSYAAGTVTSVDGQRRMGVFRLAADNTLDPTFVPAEIDGAVTALAAQADGRLLVGGSFLRVDGFSRPRLARLNATGSFDASFNSGGVGPSSTVNSILVQDDGKVVITGLFTTYNALAASGVARLTAEGALDFTVASPALALAGSGLSLAPLSGGRIAIGGNFTAVNGTSRASVVVVGPDLAVDPTFNAGSAYSGNVNIVIPQSDGRLVVGGTFSSINGVARPRLARLNSDGTVDSTFNPGATSNGTVSSVSLAPGGKLVVGGWFTPGNTTTSTGTVVRLNSDGSSDSSFAASSLNNNVNAVQVGGDGRVMVGGNFTLSGSTTRRGLARVNSDGSLDFGFAPTLWSGGTIAAFALLPDGKMLLARSFQYLRGAPVNGRLVRVNADGSLDPTFNPGGTGASSVVNAILRQPDGRILIAGSFTSYNGTPISRVAQLNADGTLDSSFVPAAPDNGVFALALLPGGRIVIGGAFQTVDGIPRPWLAGLTPTGAYDASFDPGAMNGNVNTLVAQPDGKVLVGGAFLTIGGGSSPRLARLTASGALDPFFNVGAGPNGSINAVELLPDGWILIGGSFSTYNGVNRTAVARLESTGTLDTSFVSAVAGLGASLLRQEDGRVLVRGLFTSVDGLRRLRRWCGSRPLARWIRPSWRRVSRR